MKQTAVEWLECQYIKHSGNLLEMGNVFDEAKEMEKQQKEVDYQSGYLDCYTKLMNENLTRKI